VTLVVRYQTMLNTPETHTPPRTLTIANSYTFAGVVRIIDEAIDDEGVDGMLLLRTAGQHIVPLNIHHLHAIAVREGL
jgi:hypothetical protein